MSKDYHDICNRVMQANQDMYSGPSVIMKEFESIKNDIKKLSLKIDQIHKLLQNIDNRDNY